MANKVHPLASVLLYSGAVQPFPTSAPYLVCDTMGGSLVPGMGDGGGLDFATLNPNISNEWFAQPSYSSITNLQFTRFCEDSKVVWGASGTPSTGKNDYQGWMLKPRLAYLDAKIGATATTTPDGGQTDQNFEVASGSSVWITTTARATNHGNAICNAQGPATGSARTIGNIPKNRSLAFVLNYLGQSANNARMDSRLSWGGLGDGDQYSLYFSHNQSIGLYKRVAKNGTYQWAPLFTFSDILAADLQRGEYTIYIMRIAGRMVITINNQSFWYAPKTSTPSPLTETTNGDDGIIDVVWGTGRVQIETNNCRCRMEIGVIKYSSAGGTLFSGSFTKIVNRRDPLPTIDFMQRSIAGWQREGVFYSVSVASGGQSYSVTMRTNADGIDTPFLTKVLLKQDVTYTSPSAVTLECKGAVRRIRINQQLPTSENTTGSRAEIELDMLALREICRANGVGYLDYAVPYRKIDVKLGWLKDDGTTSGLVPVFRGVVTDFDESLPSFGVHTRTLECRDLMVLLQNPAGLIEQSDAPLDFLFCANAETALSNVNQVPNPDNAVLYGWECVKEIVRRKLGGGVADDMQIWFPESHYPLMDTRRDRCGYIQIQAALGSTTPFENGFLFPAPYGEWAIDWIRRFQVLDQAVFFISFPEDDRTQWPVPVYAQLRHWLALSGRQTWRAPDRAYTTGDVDRMIEYLNSSTKYDRDINHIAVWSSPPNTDLGGIIPAVRMAEAFTTEGATAGRTWKRSLLVQHDLAYFGAAGRSGVDGIAFVVRDELNTKQPIWPDVNLPGEPTMAPGDKLQIVRELSNLIYGPSNTVSKDYSSPAGLDGLAEITCLIEAIEHNVDLTNVANPRRYTTKPQIRPLVASEGG